MYSSTMEITSAPTTTWALIVQASATVAVIAGKAEEVRRMMRKVA